MKKTTVLLLPLFAAFILGLCSACNRKPSSKTHAASSLAGDQEYDTLSYARGFTVRTLDSGIRLVDVADPQQEQDRMPVSYHFALIPKSLDEETLNATLSTLNLNEYTPVRVPVERTIVMTMLQLSNFIALDALDVISGITGTKNLFNKDIRQRVKDGRIVKIGMEGNFDPEHILSANPEVVFISPFKRGGYDVLQETGITLIPHMGYKELHPLGQAEWIKFIALFLDREVQADSLFTAIEKRYNTLKEKVITAIGDTAGPVTVAEEASSSSTASATPLHPRKETGVSRPTVFSGEMHGGNWYAVGGKSTLAQLFFDAGADYVIHDDNTGGVNIEFEQLYSLAADATYWRILNSYPGDFSYEALKASEPRNELFRAFRERKVIYCNMKQTPYYELSPVQPDVILADLIAVFHPKLMPADYQPSFYRLLK